MSGTLLTFFPFFLSEYGMLGKKVLVVLTNLSQIMVEKLGNPFHTNVAVSASRLQSSSRGCTPAWSTELVFRVPYGTGNCTGTWDWASAWRNKSRARITPRSPPRKKKCHLHNPSPPRSRIARTILGHELDTTYGDPKMHNYGTVEDRGNISA